MSTIKDVCAAFSVGQTKNESGVVDAGVVTLVTNPLEGKPGIVSSFDGNCISSMTRVICAGLVFAVHATGIVLFLMTPPPVGQSPAGQVITAISLTGPTASATYSHNITSVHSRSSARRMSAIAEHVAILTTPISGERNPVVGPIAVADILTLAGSPVLITPVSASANLIAGTCDLTGPVQSALQASSDVRARLPLIPVDRRSVANAIMVWNAGWLHNDDGATRTAYASIRDAVAAAVVAASDECRRQIQIGPRLVTLPGDGGQATVLALGSGQWTWQQVADTAALQRGSTLAGTIQFSVANIPIITHASLKTGEE